MPVKTFHMPEVPSSRKYWFFRTEGGDYYPDFKINNYIALGWDKFNDLQSLEGIVASEDIEMLKGKFKEAYPDERRNGLAVNQILTFINKMSIGDIVLIPSKNGRDLSIGIIESTAYIYESENDDTDDFFDEDDIGYLLCKYKKRRDVKWVTTIKKNKLDPQLFKLMLAHNTITDASAYDMYIDRNIFPIYVKNNRVNVALRVEQQNGISAISMSRLLYNSIQLINCYDFPDKTDAINNFEVKMMVESPGVIHFIGYAAAISILLGGISAAVFGAHIEFEILEQKYSIQTGGYLDSIKEEHRHEEAIIQEQHRHEEAMAHANEIKKSLEEMRIQLPRDLNE